MTLLGGGGVAFEGGLPGLPPSPTVSGLLRPPAKSAGLRAKTPTRAQILVPPTQELCATLIKATDPTSGSTPVTQASGSSSRLVARFTDHV